MGGIFGEASGRYVCEKTLAGRASGRYIYEKTLGEKPFSNLREVDFHIFFFFLKT
jgi:hypothetical protein